MPRKSNHALREERLRLVRERAERALRKARGRRRRHASADEHTPTRRDQAIASAATHG